MSMMTRVERAATTGFTLQVAPGCPAALDALASTAAADHGFLRAVWFKAAGAERTLIASDPSGRPLAAFPLVPAGPVQLGANAVPGAYWPFRSAVLSADLGHRELAGILRDPAARRALGPLWRMGPFYADDRAGALLREAASASGWTILTRRLGHSFALDLQAAREDGAWPRRSTLKRIRNYERQLAQAGPLTFDRVTGCDWSPAMLDDLAAVEENSWVARDTDRSGAKFINPANRAFWQAAVADPALADMLSAFILRIAGRPIAFCFDLNVGDLQYAVAGSYDEGFARQKVGKIATYRNIDWAIERGIARIDWGAGDSGYKTEIGAVQGSEIIDCLFTRSPIAAALLRPKWEGAATREGEAAGLLPIGRREMLVLGSLATAATFGIMAE
jgi:CelD/BcsL family acetyltransferase involved in cellulose biosynthesis